MRDEPFVDPQGGEAPSPVENTESAATADVVTHPEPVSDAAPSSSAPGGGAPDCPGCAEWRMEANRLYDEAATLRRQLEEMDHAGLATRSVPLRASGEERMSEHTRYLGCLGLLGECAVYVPEDLREMIEQALDDACEANPQLKWRRILNHIEIEPR